MDIKNANTMHVADNFKRIGNQIIVSPLKQIGEITPNDWIGLGYFEPDAQMAPTTDVTRSEITVQDPYGGPPIVLIEEVDEVSAVYESVEVVTPDKHVRALHQGAVPTNLTGALAGGTISPFDAGASIDARMMVIRRTAGADPDRMFEVYWHPRVAIQADGFGEYEGRPTPQFRIPVRTWDGTFQDGEDLADFDAARGRMGAIFQVPANKLDALLDVLKDEAKG